jgi:hypothetical protein
VNPRRSRTTGEEGFEENRTPMLRVMEMHWEKQEQIKHCPEYLKHAAREIWDEVLLEGRRHGFRNAQATVLAPTGTPPAIVKRLNAEIVKAVASPDLREQFAGQSLTAAGGTAEEFAALIRSDYDKWGKLIKEANIKAE